MQTSDERANAQVVRQLYEALNRNQPELIAGMLDEGVAFHGAAEEKGIAAYEALLTRLRASFPDQQFTLQDVIASGDRVVVRWTMDATHSGTLAGIPATGKRVQQRALVIYRFAGGKIAEVWAQMDQMGMLRQLGIEPLAAGRVAASPAAAN
jgi:steroid delta-isomerase-like uncharacterized protein